MELDEIKKTWNDLNGRLEKVESINKKLVSNMLNEKHQSAKDRLRAYEYKFLIFCVVFIFVSLFEYFVHIFNGASTMLFEFVFISSAIWQLYKLYLLKQMKIDVCSTTELLHKAVRYRVLTRMSTVVGMFLLIPFFVLLFMFEERLSDTYMTIAVIVGGVVGLIIGLIFFFKNLSDIDALIKSYKDLKESLDE